jgi:adenylate cyclase
MGADEAGTLRASEYRRELIDPKNKQYRGRVVKTTGDGILIEFPSVVTRYPLLEVQQGARTQCRYPSRKRMSSALGST